MRHILCNYARDRVRLKRGGGMQQVSLGNAEEAEVQPFLTDDAAERLEALGAALERLASINDRQSRVVECRFFAGLSVEETARALDVSPASVKRDWTFARAWLMRELESPGSLAAG
jgi:RNA polymerase sigma factor (TIGR02999 family)